MSPVRSRTRLCAVHSEGQSGTRGVSHVAASACNSARRVAACNAARRICYAEPQSNASARRNT
eukprot:5763880-Lingulodinium_polyedra.AAC.1